MLRAGNLKRVIDVQRLGSVSPLYPGTSYPGESYPGVGLVVVPGGDLFPGGFFPGGESIKDEYGELLTDFVTQFSTRASITPINGTEKFLNGLTNEVTHKITVRDRSDYTYRPEDRILYKGRYFNIQYVLNWNEEGVGLTILAIEHLYKDL